MPKHLHRDLDLLSRELLTMGATVEDAANKAVTALINRQEDLAQEVIAGDAAINEKENLVEEEALKILALHQPVAQDLRFIITAMKVNNDLERIGDLAVNLGERTLQMLEFDPVPVPDNFRQLVDAAQSMVRDCLNGLVNRDAELARKICEVDDQVDSLHREMFRHFQDFIKNDPSACEPGLCMISASKHLERIGDLATNIAEDIVFMVEGEIIRHSL
jgi:phosphate transport system protein